jgi:endonuclease/exonuclease/phosphatase family metal-dependent hydrolase
MSDTGDTGGLRLRVLSYNVRSLRDDAEAVARVIRAAQAHVVCLQEAPRLLRWRAKCAALSRRSGMVIVTGGRPAAGNLILSSLGVEVLARRDVLLGAGPGRHQRGAALAELRWHSRTFAVAGTHLDLEAGARQRHATELEQALIGFAPSGRPTIVAGDLNDEPGSPTWSTLSAGRVDAFGAVGAGTGYTFTAANPRRRIDGVFVSDQLPVVSATVIDSADVTAASDHRPVLVEVDWSG